MHRTCGSSEEPLRQQEEQHLTGFNGFCEIVEGTTSLFDQCRDSLGTVVFGVAYFRLGELGSWNCVTSHGIAREFGKATWLYPWLIEEITRGRDIDAKPDNLGNLVEQSQMFSRDGRH